MITTADMHELIDIVNGSHADPHHILGMHAIFSEPSAYKVIRVFNPDAAAVTAEDPTDPATRYPLSLIHKAGFFEGTLPDVAWVRYRLHFTGHDGNTWCVWDPYCFDPVLTDMDLYLFGQGTHYEIFNKLGAHPMTLDGVEGVSFAVWAPNARRVSVVGDFNKWNGLRNPMRTRQNSGIWELFIPGLRVYDIYKFEIKTFEGTLIQKSDPYAHYAELRPRTASVVYDINRYTWHDGAWMKNRDKKDPLQGPVNIYEVHAGSWKRAGHDFGPFLNWQELAADLIPYVKDMGYTHIELLPVMEYPFDGSWGYQVTGYYAPTSRFGEPAQFMAFVDQCHQNGIGVLMDWVPAHFPKDGHGLARFDGTPLYEHEDPRMGEHPDWGTLIFNYGRKEVKNFLLANALFWIEKYHIDGMRVDAVASMLYLDYGQRGNANVKNKYGGRENWDAVEFIKHMNSVVRGKYPHVLMIAEESTTWEGVTRAVDDDGLGFSLKWNMGWMNDFLSYISKETFHRKYHHTNLTFGMMYAHTENFILVLSHDEVVHGKGALVNKMPGDTWQKLANLRASLGFMMGHPGKKLLFMGGELAQFEEWNEAKGLNWFLLDQYEHHRQAQLFVKDLNHLYLKEKACWFGDMHGGGFSWINCDDAERSLISFYRVGEAKRRSKADQAKKGPRREYLIFAVNFTPTPYLEHRIGVPLPGKYTELLNSDDSKYGGSGITNPGTLTATLHECDRLPHSVPLRMPPLSVVILKRKAD